MLNFPEELLKWDNLGKAGILKAGHQLSKPELLFNKIEDEEIKFQLDKLEAVRKENEEKKRRMGGSNVMPPKNQCIYEDFEKLDIRTATVLEAERVPKTDKLLKLFIDTGLDRRTIVSGIAEYYTPEEMVGKQICIVANLASKKIRGIESKGMILMAKEADGKMRIITPEEKMSNGAVIS